ncbi:MAG: DapH/DapD/GlmU-related protein [Promethearchaeota archaeon]
MSAPTSLKFTHPLFIDAKIRNKHMIPYILHIWFSLIPIVIGEVYYFKLFKLINPWIPGLLLPLNFIIAYYILILIALFIMKIRLFFLNLRHKPREGIFKRDLKNKDYKFYCLRNFARLWPSYLIASTPFPLFRVYLYLHGFNIKVGKNSLNQDIWVSPEFVEIGNNVKIGFSSAILSSFIENDKLIIKRIIIKDNVKIGVKTTIFPGVIIGENSIIEAGSYILPLEEIPPNSVYSGEPADKIMEIDEIDFSKNKIIHIAKKLKEFDKTKKLH